MIGWLKKYFIPHEGNDHQPLFLREKNTRLVIISVFLIELLFISVPHISSLNVSGNNYLAEVISSVLDDLTNQNRQAQSLPTLAVSPVLNKVAELKVADMAKIGYFAHTSPEGKAPWFWFHLAGYNYEYAGENLAIDFTDSKDVDSAWMNSPTHKANILKSAYTEIGTAIATGTYEGHSTVFVAQVFGKPAVEAATVVKSSPKPTVFAPNKVVASLPPSSAAVVPVDTSAPISVVVTVVSSSTQENVASILNPNVMGAEVQTSDKPYTQTTLFEQYLTSPRHLVNIILAILAIVVSIAVLLKIFIRIDKKHPALVTNGLIVIVLIVGVYAVNSFLAQNKSSVTTTFVGFHADQFDQVK